MGPKKGGDGPSKKTIEKQKDKVIEDKTFGLKNKNKSKVVQQYIKGVESVVKGKSVNKELEAEFAEKALKKKLKEEEAFLNSLSKSVTTIKQIECDDDNEKRNLLCAFFAKQGFCEDGDQCKFSHDVNIEFNVSFYLKISKVLLIFTLT
jgi:Zinc finger C-x8-C-x5-C-x3-H type (and similar)